MIGRRTVAFVGCLALGVAGAAGSSLGGADAADPDAPVITAATFADNGVRLEFVAPPVEPGSTITNYVYQFSLDDGQTWLPDEFGDLTTSATSPTFARHACDVFEPCLIRISALIDRETLTAWSDAVVVVPLAAPTITDATFVDDGVRLEFVAPPVGPGATITDYVYQYSLDDGQTWAPDELGDLTTSVTSPTFARNACGPVGPCLIRLSAVIGERWLSVWSDAVEVTPLAAPTITDATFVDDGVRLEFVAPPVGPGATITDYVYQYSLDDGQTWAPDELGDLTTSVTSPTFARNACGPVGPCLIRLRTVVGDLWASEWSTAAAVDMPDPKLDQTITFEALPDRFLGDPAFVVAPTASSGLPVTVSVTGSAGVCTSSGTNGTTITVIGKGSCNVLANQAGDATYNPAPPAGRSFQVRDPASFTALAAGSAHSCAASVLGPVTCWGENGDGQLGNGFTQDRSVPVAVAGLSTASVLAAGGKHSCAVLDDQTVKCWGDDSQGQLGDDAVIADRHVPTAVAGLSGVRTVVAGGKHSCAVLDDGTVACWGDNDRGQLGDGTTTDRRTPTPVPGLTDVTSIAAGEAHTCAVSASTTVVCWGYNNQGQLGDATTTTRRTPTQVSGSPGGRQVVTGKSFSCALPLPSGPVKCWGDNAHGQLGNGLVADSLVPVDVSGLTNAFGASAHGDHVCALQLLSAWCWGSNGSGQLGDDSTTDRRVPVAVAGLTAATRVAAGGLHSCGLSNSATVLCWGENNKGQLGDSTTSDRHVATPVVTRPPLPPTDVSVVSASTIKDEGSVKVSFIPPTAAGITRHVATCTSSDGGAFALAEGKKSPVTVPFLTTGKSYTCEVQAGNDIGLGDTSILSPVVIVGAPSAAKKVAAKSVAAGSLSVSFAGAAANGAKITSYAVSCTSSDGGAPGAASGPKTPVVVSSLTSGKTYSCSVRAHNARGEGSVSAPSAPVVVS